MLVRGDQLPGPRTVLLAPMLGWTGDARLRPLPPQRRSASLPRLALSKYSGQTHHLWGPEATRCPCRIQIVVDDRRTRNASSKGFLTVRGILRPRTQIVARQGFSKLSSRPVARPRRSLIRWRAWPWRLRSGCDDCVAAVRTRGSDCGPGQGGPTIATDQIHSGRRSPRAADRSAVVAILARASADLFPFGSPRRLLRHGT